MAEIESRRSELDRNQRGSAMLIAVFVLALIAVTGLSLLFLTFTDLRMGQAGLQTKKAFFLAEAGLEDARTSLYNTNGGGEFDDDLENAAGGTVDGIEFDPANLTVSYASDGTPTLAGFGDDVPLRGVTPLGEGWYAAFLTNDPGEVVTQTADGNDKVMITGIGMGPDRSLEVVQAILLREEIFPSIPPAAITLLGPAPVFEGATSTPKIYDGEDCGGSGIPGLHVPVVGTIGSDAEASAEAGIHGNPTYQSGPYTREDTFADLTDPTEDTVLSSGYGAIDPVWTDCLAVKEMIETTRVVADFICSGNSCTLPATTASSVVFIDGDMDLDGGTDGQGMLLVTGELRVHGGADWRGMLYALGEGQFARYGSGNGTLSGASMVADVAGPDGIYGNTDDCTGGDGGFGNVLYDERGGGNSDTVYCTTDFFFANPVRPYDVVAFRQQ